MTKKVHDQVEVFEQALKGSKEKKYVLRLYVAGATPKSTEAIMNIKKICEEHLKGRYELEVIDIYQQPVLAKGEQIIAAPTLVKNCRCRCASLSAAWRTWTVSSWASTSSPKTSRNLKGSEDGQQQNEPRARDRTEGNAAEA